MVECTTQETQDTIIKPWNVVAGELTEVNIGGSIFAVRRGTKLNPIKAARDFIEAFDISRTTVLRKAGVGNVPNTEVPSTEQEIVTKKKRARRTGEIVGKANNLPIIKEDIVGFYRIKPDVFSMESMKDYFRNVYMNNLPEDAQKPSENSVLNKQRATLKFMVEKGYVKQIEGKGNYHRKYEWKERPWGVEPAAQADVSPQYLMDLRKRELMTIRQS